jgi:CRP-like cAMP-binding protein
VERFGFSERMEVVMAIGKSRPAINWGILLAEISRGKKPVEYSANCEIFQQGQAADSLLYLRRGKVKLTVISKHGKEATLALLSAGEFFGEGCLAGQQARMATATAMTACTLDKIGKLLMTRILHERHEISEMFVAHLLSRNLRYEADLVDRFFNSSEQRLARILLLLSHFGQESRAEPVASRVSQANLAQMIGTTRSRVSHLINKFRKLGFIDHGDNGGLIVQSGLLSVVLHD